MATKRIKSQFKHVEIVQTDEHRYYRITLPKVTKESFEGERAAAIAADKILIKRGKDPVNILKKL